MFARSVVIPNRSCLQASWNTHLQFPSHDVCYCTYGMRENPCDDVIGYQPMMRGVSSHCTIKLTSLHFE